MAKTPRSSFYYKEIKRDYHEVKEAILSLYKKNRKRDGYRPMTFKLRKMGFNLNHKTALKLMNELGIHSINLVKLFALSEPKGTISFVIPEVEYVLWGHNSLGKVG